MRDEYEASVRDIYGRLPHPLAGHINTMDPDVSRYLAENGWSPKYPGGREFAVCLTHDIDNLMISTRRGIYNSLENISGGDISGAFHSMKRSMSRRTNPLFNFGEIMDLEEKYGARSTFFFLCLNKGERDFNYEISEIGSELKSISERGFEIALHGSHFAYKSKRRIADEKRKLEKAAVTSITGYRNHFLRFIYPDTWDHLERSDFKYDSTMAYSNTVGWKNGTCHPFHPFDRNKGEFLKIWEIPLAVMDRTLIGRLGLDHDNSLSLVDQLIDRVRELNGVLTINWHNSEFSNENGPLYGQILEMANSKGAWMTSASDLIDHVKDQFDP
ncbi:MAG: polysaccharide deacetylase family protein [Thermoplasmatota archaeon]